MPRNSRFALRCEGTWTLCEPSYLPGEEVPRNRSFALQAMTVLSSGGTYLHRTATSALLAPPQAMTWIIRRTSLIEAMWVPSHHSPLVLHPHISRMVEGQQAMAGYFLEVKMRVSKSGNEAGWMPRLHLKDTKTLFGLYAYYPPQLERYWGNGV